MSKRYKAVKELWFAIRSSTECECHSQKAVDALIEATVEELRPTIVQIVQAELTAHEQGMFHGQPPPPPVTYYLTGGSGTSEPCPHAEFCVSAGLLTCTQCGHVLGSVLP